MTKASKYFVFILILQIIFMFACTMERTNNYCAVYEENINNYALNDEFITKINCQYISDTLVIELIDTAIYPFPELDVFRSYYLLTFLFNKTPLPAQTTFKTNYINYGNQYLVNISKSEAQNLVNQLNSFSNYKSTAEYVLFNFTSNDWPLMHSLNDTLSTYFENYKKQDLIEVLFAPISQNTFDTISPTAADDLAFLYHYVNLHDTVVANKLEVLLTNINYPNLADSKKVRKKFKRR